MESTQATLGRDRSPSVVKPKLNLTTRHNTSDSLNCYGSLGRSPTSPHPECKPKSILKKSNSNIESRSLGYVNLYRDSLRPNLLYEDIIPRPPPVKPPLHHSLSYTPGFTVAPSSSSSPPTFHQQNDESSYNCRSLSYDSGGPSVYDAPSPSPNIGTRSEIAFSAGNVGFIY